MKKIVCIVLLAVSCMCFQQVNAQHLSAIPAQKQQSKDKAHPNLLTQEKATFPPIEFVENKGQWPDEVLFRGEAGNGYVFLTKTGITVQQHHPEDLSKIYTAAHGMDSSIIADSGTVNSKTTAFSKKLTQNNLVLRSHTYKVHLANSSIASSKVIGEKAQPSVVNYIYGEDPSNWGTNCQTYLAVTYKNVYKNIDMRFYSDGGLLKYDFIAKPGSRVKDILLEYEGVDKISIKKNQLHLKTSVGEFIELYPYTYQSGGTERKEVSCKYILKNKNNVAFEVGEYDATTTLVIDPSLVFSSFSGSTADNWGFTATYGPDGSFYGGGIVFGNGFPTQSGAFQQNFQGGNSGGGQGYDMSIIKLDPRGRDRVYATYIGGSGDEQPHSMVVDEQGNLVIAGRTNSPNFPVKGSGPNIQGGGWDIIVVKLNAAGTALIGTARIGGSGNDGVNINPNRNSPLSLQRNYGDDARSEVILDAAGNIYLASCTQSSNMPFQNSSIQNQLKGAQDAVLLKFTPDLSQMLFGTYLGGTGNDAAYVLALAANGDIYVAGGTESSDFPVSRSGVIASTRRGEIDGFVAVVSNNGSSLLRGTFISSGSGGERAITQVYGIQFDRLGFPYIMGTTTGIWTTKNAAFKDQGAKQFVAKLNLDLSDYIFSTTFGTPSSAIREPNISPTAFMVDRCENMYISGWGGPISGYGLTGTSGMYVPDIAYQTRTDGKDLYFIVIEKNAASVLYATFFGQLNGLTEHVDGGTSRFDPNGIIYQTICANCSKHVNTPGPRPKYPTSPDAWSPLNPSDGCNMGLLKFRFDYTGVAATLKSRIDGVPSTKGCVPLTVELYDSIRNAKSYKWEFEDGTEPIYTTEYTLMHTFTTVGQHKVKLTAYDPESCNGFEESELIITVGDNKAELSFTFAKDGACDELRYIFTNTSTTSGSGLPFKDDSFTWDFGLGYTTPPTGLGPTAPINYAAPGTYNVKLNLIDPDYCNSPASEPLVLRVATTVKAKFNTPATGCAPYDAVFTNESEGGVSFVWDFGDGNTSTGTGIVTHRYETAGTYHVTLTATDPNTCNITDISAPFTITIADKPTADFTFQPVVPMENTPVNFFNSSSSDAIRFVWQFGDGASETTTNPNANISHLYNKTGEYPAKLIVENSAGCTDEKELIVPAIVNPLLDVPSAFTPQRGGINSVIHVNGFGIGKILFRIYNRWGQMVFESNSIKNGWNGTFKGTLQPMDVYTYIVEAEFTDGTKLTKRGDITLIR